MDATVTVTLRNGVGSTYYGYTLTFSGTATRGTDYKWIDPTGTDQSTLGSIAGSINQVNPTLEYTLRILGDTTKEFDETIIATLSGARNGARISPSAASATYTIGDNDRPRVTVDVIDHAPEGTKLGCSFLFPNTGSDAFTINYKITQKGDFLASGEAGDKTVSSGTNRVATTGWFSTNDDSVDEPDGEVTCALRPGGLVYRFDKKGSSSSGTITVKDNDPTVVSLARVGTGAVTEGDKVEFTVTLGRLLVEGEVIDVSLEIGGTGVTTGDWSLARKPGMSLNTGVMLSGETTATPKLRFSGEGAQVATLELTTARDNMAETGGSETFEVELGSNADFDAETGTNVSGGADPHRTANDFSVVVNDQIDHAASITVSPSKAAEGNSGSAHATVTVSLSAADTTSVPLVVCLSGTATGQSGTKQSGDDYQMRTTGGTGLAPSDQGGGCTGIPAAVSANATSASFRLHYYGDTALEPDETVVMTLRKGSGAPADVGVSATQGSATFTIEDDDGRKVTLSSSRPTLTEGGSGGADRTTLRATLSSAAPSGGVTVPLARVAANSTAAAATDYTLAGSIAIAQGATTGTATLTVRNDTADEPRESLRVGFGALPSGVTAGSTSQVDHTIVDDDPTTVALSLPDATATEGDSAQTATIHLALGRALAAGESLGVPLAIDGGTAGTDYSLKLSGSPRGVTLKGGTVTFAGRAQGSATAADVLLTALDDADAATDMLTVSIPASSTTGTPRLAATALDGGASGSRSGNGVIAVTDVDAPPKVSFNADEQGADEGTTAMVRVNLSPAPGAAVAVGYAASGSATPGADYARLPGTVTAQAGDRHVDIPVSILDDNADETDETVQLQLLEGEGYALGSTLRRQVVNVWDTDGLPSVRIGGNGTVAEGGDAVFSLASSPRPQAPVQVTVEVLDDGGFAAPGETGRRTATLGTNGRGELRVATADDEADEPDGRITARVLAGAGYEPSSSRGSVFVSVRDNDAPQGLGGEPGDGGSPPPPPPPPPPSTGGGGGGGSSNRPPAVEEAIPAQSLKVGEVVEVSLRSPAFHDDDLDFLNFAASSSNPDVVAAEADDLERLLTLRASGRGRTEVTVTASDRSSEPVGQIFKVTVIGPALVPYLPKATDPFLQGFVRIANRSGRDAEITVTGADDEGLDAGPVTLGLGAGRTVHLNAGDLEQGNAAKGLPDGLGAPATGDWRLTLESEADFDAFAYVRTGDGFVTPVHGSAPFRDGALRVATFNPASNWRQVSRLRLVNPGGRDADVAVAGTDDAGAPGDGPVELTIPAGKSATLTATDLETGAGVEGALGDGVGKWRLAVESDAPIVAMGLLSSPGGRLSNLSAGPVAPDADGTHHVPLVPSASDPDGRQGFVRILNRSERDGRVRIAATDDAGRAAPPLALSIGAGRTVHLNANDLEMGNADKGLPRGAGTGEGGWRLALSSDLDLDVSAYLRAPGGFLTEKHGVAPRAAGAHRVVTFNPGSNHRQASLLRLVNPGNAHVAVTVAGVDDAGEPGGPVRLAVPAGESRTLSAAELESGGAGLSGALGDGAGKWRLVVEADGPIIAMGLLSSPTGHLSNLSRAPWLNPPSR